MKFLCAGAGSAGLGVCAQIVDGMVEAGVYSSNSSGSSIFFDFSLYVKVECPVKMRCIRL